MRQLLTNKESSGYRRIPVQAPELTKYVVENFDELMKSENILKPVAAIKDEYDIIENNKIAEVKNKSAEENNKIADYYNKIADYYNKIADYYNKINAKF